MPFFRLLFVLRDISKLAKNTINKSPIISKIFLKKIIEFFLHYQIFSFEAMLLLVLLLDYCLAEKQGGKKDSIWLISSSGFKIIFTLLVKTIVIKI